jgi:hypothetical protein
MLRPYNSGGRLLCGAAAKIGADRFHLGTRAWRLAYLPDVVRLFGNGSTGGLRRGRSMLRPYDHGYGGHFLGRAAARIRLVVLNVGDGP